MVSPPSLMPHIAVIVPAYGVAHLMGEALASLQAQSPADWECLVIDDGAPDDVASAVAPFLANLRVRFVATANRGVSAARNRAIANSSAPYIALLDGDDLLRPRYLQRTVAVREREPQARIAACNARIFGTVPGERRCMTVAQGRGDGVRGSLSDVIDRTFNVYITSTFRRADFAAVGRFDPRMAQSEDFDIGVRLMLLGAPAHYLDEVLADYDFVSRPVWALAFSAWRVFPGLARPLPRWRRRAHRRGGALTAVSDVAAIVPSLIEVA